MAAEEGTGTSISGNLRSHTCGFGLAQMSWSGSILYRTLCVALSNAIL